MLNLKFKTVDELVADVSQLFGKMLLYKSSKEKFLFDYIMCSYSDNLLEILKSDTNKPSIHDLSIIDAAIKQLESYPIKIDTLPVCQIIEIYKNR